ncbi:unnamed protein product [Arctia plantaginis]|uniref:lysozyme n=1 Tax=Arctia plantaginis TaxID=874455 RepID=A0A8S0ZBP8_ARCPL|nr:unnamed protein product [Arctia plantaginis]
MSTRSTLVILPICVFAVIIFWISTSNGASVSNLSGACYKCLCHVATGCNMSRGCPEDGYCGPYKISRIYWKEAGEVLLPEDDPVRINAWQDCARNYYCAQKIVGKYLEKFGRDCNGDGLTNCYDFMMLNYNGGYGCTTPLEKSENGRHWLRRYEECRI